ncbi:hypothetical protein ACLOJK_029026 [Asimina triloba]
MAIGEKKRVVVGFLEERGKKEGRGKGSALLCSSLLCCAATEEGRNEKGRSNGEWKETNVHRSLSLSLAFPVLVPQRG